MTVIIIAPFMGVKEHVSARRLAGLAIGLIGVVALLGIDSLHSAHEWIGAGCILLSTLGYACGPLIVQRHLADMQPLGVVAASTAVGAAVLLIPALVTAPSVFPSATALTSVAILGIGLVLILLGCWMATGGTRMAH